MSSSIPPNSLREALVRAFSLDELKALCSDLGINPDEIPFAERGIGAWAREVVLAFQRRGRMLELCAACEARRPALAWEWHELTVETLTAAEVPPTPAPTLGASDIDASGSQGASVGNTGKIEQQFGNRQELVIKPEAGGTVNVYTFASPPGNAATTPAPRMAEVNGYTPDDMGRVLQAAQQNDKGDALMALRDLLQNPIVRDVVVQAKTTLSGSYAQIERINYAKGVHDLLQRIALTYNLLHPMLYEHNTLRPAGYWRWADAKRCGSTLKTLIQEILDFATKQAADAVDDAAEDWLEELRQSDSDLAVASTRQDSEKLDGALSLLRDILNAQPTRYNIRMIEAIRALNTPQLTQTLRGVANDIVAFKEKLDTQARARLDDYVGGVALVHQLIDAMLRLRDEHDRCQALDDLLRTEYAQLYTDASRLRAQWQKRIGPKFELTLKSSPAVQAQDLGSCAEALQASFASGNIIEVRESLWDLRSSVNRRFNQVDKDLKDVCHKFAKVSQPLGAVIEHLN